MSDLKYTELSEIVQIRDRLDASFKTGKTRNVAFRKKQLAKLAYLIKDNTTVLCQALNKDLNRNVTETVLGETSIVLSECVQAFNNVDKWAKNYKPPTESAYKLMNVHIKPTPKGVALIISPFNYPILLVFTPLIGALAAGCTVVLKLPETLLHTSPLIENLVKRYLDPSVVQVVQGGVTETTKLLELQWDHILFTGSTRVGRIVAAAAAKYNTPVTLELGGKTPVIVDPRKANFNIIAKRILWGRITNTGQACVAPEYVLIPRSAQNDLIKALKKAYKELLTENPERSDSLARLTSVDATKRIKGYLDETKGKIVLGGKSDLEGKYIEPTIISDVKAEDSTMQEEIFGPILSIVPIDKLDDAITFMKDKPLPLAMYVFSHDKAFKEKVANNTRSGSIIYNDTMLHVGAPGLPLGGVGASGNGQYKGKHGFDTFSHLRSSLDAPFWLDHFTAFRYPPWTKSKHKRVLQLTYPSIPFDRNGRKTWLAVLPRWIVAILFSAFLVLAYRRGGKEWLLARLPITAH